MCRGVVDMVDGEKLVPFVRLFCAQGDPLMPFLFSPGAAPGWWQFKHRSSKVNDFFWTTFYVVCAPSRVGEVHLLLQRHLLEQTNEDLERRRF